MIIGLVLCVVWFGVGLVVMRLYDSWLLKKNGYHFKQLVREVKGN